jgi:PAS domain S-box-containing protein
MTERNDAKSRERPSGKAKPKPKPKRAPPKRQAASRNKKGVVVEAERLAAIVEGSDDAIISKTLDGVVTSWNAGATRIFGYTAQEMIGRPIAGIIPLDLQDEERDIIAKLRRGEHIAHFDTIRLAKDARRVAVSLSVSPLRDAEGTVVGASKIARDISARKQAEEALRNANEAAQQARMEAEAASRAKTEFLSVLSHKIRTPLNSIGGFVDLLTNSTELTAQQRRYAGLVRAANVSLLTIVNDMLDFSKVEAGRADSDGDLFSVTALVHDTVAIVAPTARAKHLALGSTIERGMADWVVGDQARLRQVLLNLLINAVKFTDEGSVSVDVRAEAGADGQERVRFAIADTGVGVPPEQHYRLFEQFSQAESSVGPQSAGTGLGLAICRRMVELMSGEIGIASDVDHGTTIWFTALLPRAARETRTSKTGGLAEDSGASRARILVIDDIDTNLEIIEAYLQDHGYHVDCVSSGLEAIQLLEKAQYDLILMDIQMPVMDGVAATKRIRALPPPIRDVPIIAMTGNVMPQLVRSFLEAGMNDHVGKPIERAKLYSNVRRWLPKAVGGDAQVGLEPTDFDVEKFEDFVGAVGSEKAERIANKFLASLTGSFRSTLVETQREAHALINTAGSLGLDSFVDACRRVAEFVPSHDPERGRAAIEELVAAQAAARQTLLGQVLPKLQGEPLRSAG